MMFKSLAFVLVGIMGIGIMAGCTRAKAAPDSASSNEETSVEDTTAETEYVDDAVITSGKLTGSECIDPFTWQAKDGSLIRFSVGRTFMTYDKDGKPDGKVGFWKKVDDESICLMDSNLNELTTMTNTDIDDDIIVNAEGEEFTLSHKVPDGTYSCMMNNKYLDGDQLIITADVPYWVANADVADLKVGSVINYSDCEDMGTEVEKLDKENDTHYVINDCMNLTYDKNADAWLFECGACSLEQIGTCPIKDEALRKTLVDALEKEDFIYPVVTVGNGVVTEVKIS